MDLPQPPLDRFTEYPNVGKLFDVEASRPRPEIEITYDYSIVIWDLQRGRFTMPPSSKFSPPADSSQ
jgi:hypothetical protein